MIYLDNAATTYPKPRATRHSVIDALYRPIGNPGRGGHRASMCSAEVLYSLRETLAEEFGLEEASRVVLTKNATEALNLAILGTLVKSERVVDVVVSAFEHNSVLRPLYELERQNKVRLHVLEPEAEDTKTLVKFASALTQDTAMVAFSVITNTTGQRLPVEQMARLAHEKGAVVLLDASQAAGHERLSIKTLGADYLCFPAHKGLYGITGLGALLVAPDAPIPEPLMFGGAGVASMEREMPAELPERLEAGTVSVHAAGALLGGLWFLEKRGIENISLHEHKMSARLHDAALEMGCAVYSKRESGIVLLNVANLSSEETAEALDREGIAVRAGLHCAPLAHRAMGTLSQGAVRFSPSAFTRKWQVERCIDALWRLTKNLVRQR